MLAYQNVKTELLYVLSHKQNKKASKWSQHLELESLQLIILSLLVTQKMEYYFIRVDKYMYMIYLCIFLEQR